MGGNFGETTLKDGTKVPKVDDAIIDSLADASAKKESIGGQIISGKEFTDHRE